MLQVDEMSYEEYYSIPSSEYENQHIASCDFSVRTYNRLMLNNIHTVADLLRTTPESLLKIRGFGKSCCDEVRVFCESLQSGLSEFASGEEESIPSWGMSYKKPYIITDNIESIVFGDFSFADNPEVDLDDKKTIRRYESAFSVLGEELAFDCVSSPEKIKPIIMMLNEHCAKTKRNIEIYKLAQMIPEQRKSNKAIGYIKAFTTDVKERELLLGLCESEESTVFSMLNGDLSTNDEAYVLLKRFVKWCEFDLNAEISELLDRLYTDEKSRLIVQLRAEKQTLQYVGDILGITRERVRQIEARLIRKFIALHRKVRIISKISAERNGDMILTPEEIELYCGENTTSLLFFLQNYPGVNYTYNKQLDVFVVGDDSLSGRVQAYIETLPKLVVASKVKEIIKDAQENEDLPEEMVEKAFFDAYQLTGEVYHRNRLLRTDIYREVLKKHFPNGIRIHDSKDLSMFREFIMAEFGDIGISEGDRALGARIASVCILRGRGIYTHKRKEYIPKALADKIYNYIFDSDETIFMTNTLFSVFEDELVDAGIDNKYYLQGVLRELYNDQLFFRRDYVSKDPNITSLYSSIVQFIQKSRYPVSKDKIYEAFPGVTDIVVLLAVSDHEVLNYFGEYLHCSKLDISENEVEYLDNLISKTVSDRDSHHTKDIYEEIKREKPEILTRNAAMFPFSAFSILEYLFRDKYQFSRPYVALNDVEIGRAAERLHEFVYSNDELYISDLQAASKECRYQIYSVIDYLNECNDKFLIADSKRIISIEVLGVDEEKAKLIEQIVLEEVTETIPINQLTVWSKLPKVNAPWNEWLLYSVINKWGSKLTVSTSSNQFRVAVPLIAPRDNFDENAYKNIVSDSSSTIYVADDLSDMDSLLEDMISDDLFEDL